MTPEPSGPRPGASAMSTHHDLLSEPLVRIRRDDGSADALSLPHLFAALSAEQVRGFTVLRPHQRHPWHAFLVQLAAIAVHAQGHTAPWSDAADWHRALLALTPDPTAWCLVAPPQCPALLQPPVPGDSLEGWADDTPTPDALDLLITSKNHELKGARIACAGPDDWLFALVSLQTAGPYNGSSNYGVSRMNGGSSSRPGVGVEPGGGPGRRWRRDLGIALAERSRLVAEYGYRDAGGHALLWLLPWDGNAGLGFASLDPFYIEICRRVRLVGAAGALRARRTGSKAPRIAKADASARKGNTGDLWTPVEKAAGKSLGVSADGFGYKRMVTLLFGAEYRRPPAQELTAADDHEGLVIVARAIAGGQSTTDGYHERRVPVSRTLRQRLIARDTDPLAALASARVAVIDKVRGVLWSALATLFNGGSHTEKPSDSVGKQANRFARAFEQREDARFFDGPLGLIAEIEAADAEAVRRAWYLDLAKHAESDLQQAFHAGPCTGQRRYRARAEALSRLYWGLRNRKKMPADLVAALSAAAAQAGAAPPCADPSADHGLLETADAQ